MLFSTSIEHQGHVSDASSYPNPKPQDSQGGNIAESISRNATSPIFGAEGDRVVSTISILIVEDVQVNQLVIEAILNRLGHTIDIANHGLEAIDSVNRKHYDVIFMDICMPYMDGMEATKKIREMNLSTIDPWIIALTAHTILGNREQCLAVGMNDYLVKPITLKTIESALDRYRKK